ncbi:MAG TPA: lysophospholipid acyltransferase family protein [Terriglobales bacterium]|jgi:1-acyl-sn-glycerol-3-phosphate acyltransferase|nr:lysophospholipid acyltransferase family protein [Terriglobales bacterium]
MNSNQQLAANSGVARPPLRQSQGRPSPARNLLSRVRSYLIFDPLIWCYTIVLAISSLLSSFIDRDGRIQHAHARLWSWLILKTSLSPLTVRGLDRIDTSKPHLYAVNHASAMDIPVLYVGLPFQFRIVAKKELFRYPFMGWHLSRSGQVRIDQQNPAKSIGMLKSAVKTLQSGMPLVIFPEGGRTPSGEVKEFLAGAFFMAIKAQADIIPMAIVGTYEMLKMNTFHIKPRPLQLLVGDPIPTTGLTLRDMEALSSRVKTSIEDLYYSRSSIPDPRR